MIVYVDRHAPTHESAVCCEVCRGTTELVYRDGKFLCRARHTGIMYHHNDPYKLPFHIHSRVRSETFAARGGRLDMEKSKVELTDTVLIRIEGHKHVRGNRFEVAKDDLLGKFLKWSLANPDIEIHFQQSGLGSFLGWAPICHREAIADFFRSEGVTV